MNPIVERWNIISTFMQNYATAYPDLLEFLLSNVAWCKEWSFGLHHLNRHFLRNISVLPTSTIIAAICMIIYGGKILTRFTSLVDVKIISWIAEQITVKLTMPKKLSISPENDLNPRSNARQKYNHWHCHYSFFPLD